ncbi:hypothetical protein BCV69DRAFT_284933 [Microstroma glucosiphilum]|uniref:Rpr2-domain-containing protein n=1 Tax=Pseudomicrostroma glucosiphilum TaxID=1684307 RepID=A0A316TZV0_9BASI|nr:hypothetical protein BCV69DRAFT_284933 [Pseudomicrostroma glucosiphilum]PWN18627.1 hypothetical protein BCV69DRAFT_284933 [Pseudomicrostroma glucosiphilum]
MPVDPTTAAIGFPGGSASLYHLHAAVAALLPSTSSSDSSGSSTSLPLPSASLCHSRAFLLDLKSQADDVAGSSSGSSAAPAVGTSRSGLWQTEQEREREASESLSLISRRHRGEERALGDALDALPAHWKLHNAFCSRCVGVVVPGITASSLVGKGKQREVEPHRVAQGVTLGPRSKDAVRKRKRMRQSANADLDGPPLVCLLCQTGNTLAMTSSKRRKDRHLETPAGILKSYSPLTSEEKLAKKASLSRFQSVRRREGVKEVGAARQETRPPAAQMSVKVEKSQLEPMSSNDTSQAQRDSGSTLQAGGEGNTSKRSLQPDIAAPNKTMLLASPAPRSKQSEQKALSKALLPDPTANTPTSKPPAKTTAALPAVQSGTGNNKKKDHKAALRAMLAKGGAVEKKGSSSSKSKEEERPASGGGGGGLRDFLAGL